MAGSLDLGVTSFSLNRADHVDSGQALIVVIIPVAQLILFQYQRLVIFVGGFLWR